MARQTRALGRLSFYLEDAELHGQVIREFPTGRRGGVLAYSGHNMRSEEVAEFLTLAASQGIDLWPEERLLVDHLVAAGILRWDKGGACYCGTGACVISVCSGSDPKEARDSLLHESMHGLFYCYPDFSAACQEYWERELREQERAMWREFLLQTGYDSTNDILCVNELQVGCREEEGFRLPNVILIVSHDVLPRPT